MLFIAFDVLVAVLIKWLVELEYGQTLRAMIRTNIRARRAAAAAPAPSASNLDDPDDERGLPAQLPRKYADQALWSACAWLYNPFTAVIATRGNGDALTGALVLGTLYLLLRRERGTFGQYLCAGVLHGFAVHVRLYPIVFSLSYYMFAGRSSSSNSSSGGDSEPGAKRTGILSNLLRLPTSQQCGLVIGTVGTLITLTVLFYALYGYEFIHETYLYHVIRKDTRHNFSLFFYQQYLQADWPYVPVVQSLLRIGPVLLIVLLISASHWSVHRKLLPFAVFLHTFAVVTFNTVLTTQYFVWFMAIAPVCLANFRVRWRWPTAVAFAGVWLLAQALWLGTAYLLEFRGWNTFHFVWLHGAVFFGANVALMLRLVRNFALKPM